MDWFTTNTPLIIGHRGASATAPENTLAAFAQAVALGADGVELDVQLSADGWPVVCHDFRVDRVTNGTGLVTQMTVAQLHALDAGQGEYIPTLDEVFELLGPDMLINVELKSWDWRDKGLETAVADRIQSHNRDRQVLVSSFNPLALRRARRHLTQSTPLGILRAQGWLQYSYLFSSSAADHPHHAMVNEAYMAWAKQRGYRVHVWTVDEPAEAQRLAALGVHGIITNKPDLIRASLNK
ncbi:MAG: glycerophosphodiester phosphodiesterase [Ardenticatenaceae bacterium]|nr:glycerophosphodiester phosphodiesterase [Ardenticatenaceae bacterium]